MIAASTVISCDATTRRSHSASTAGARAVVAAGEPVAVGGDTSTRPRRRRGRSGHWPAFGRLSGKSRGLSRRNESIIGATISPDGIFGTSVELAQLGELGLVAVDPDLAIGDRREVDAPPLAPLRLLGEEAGEELDEVTVARAGQHAEALEQRELHAVARDEVALGELGRDVAELAADLVGEVDRLVGELLGIGEQLAQRGPSRLRRRRAAW